MYYENRAHHYADNTAELLQGPWYTWVLYLEWEHRAAEIDYVPASTLFSLWLSATS